MIDSFIGACETLVSVVSGKGKNPTSRISRVGMPNGFFLNDLLWFGDGASKKTAISRGFMVEPGEISAFSVTQLNNLHERLRILLGILGEEFALQVQWSIDSDYRHELEAYHRETLNLRRQDPVHGQFGVLIRAERYERYKTAMEEGRLRRERLTLFFTRIIDTRVPVAGYPAVAEYFDAFSRKESLALCEFAMGALSRLFPDCRITPMRDRDHFLFYYRFLNTNLQATAIDPLDLLDPGYAIQQNCLHGEGRGNLVGIRTRLGNTPQHGVLFGMTGAGKSVIVADLLAQTEHRFGFRLIVEEGLSHAILTQTLLPEISRELLTRLMEATSPQKVEVTVKDGTFAYHYD